MSDKNDEREEKLINAARKGDIEAVLTLLNNGSSSANGLNVNYKGKTKSTFGWTALHVAVYFGHINVLEVLLSAGADVDIKNDVGDTALHKAAFSGREDIVLTLLKNGSNSLILNSEGKSAVQLAKSDELKTLILDAEKQEKQKLETCFFSCAREGNLKQLKKLLFAEYPLDINCVDSQGNTALHSAAYRGKKEVAVMLLQNGANPSLKNNVGQTAFDLTRDVKMKKLLDVQPSQVSRNGSTRRSTKSFKHVYKIAPKFEGYLLKRSRFFGWKKYWVVLEKGVISWFSKRADSVAGIKRQGLRHLENAVFATVILECLRKNSSDLITQVSKGDEYKIKMQFSDNSILLWSAIKPGVAVVSRQSWLNSLHEHQAYSTYFMNQPSVLIDDELEECILPVETMENALKGAQAHQNLLKKQVSIIEDLLSGITEDLKRSKSTFLSIKDKLTQVLTSAKEMYNSLNHCLSLVSQQEEARRLQLDEEAERRRVLEDALHVLAAEHHVLSSSLANFSEDPSKISSWDASEAEEYYSPQEEMDFMSASDQEENDYDIYKPANGDEEANTSTGSNNHNKQDLLTNEEFQVTNAIVELPEGRHRTSLPVPMLSRSDFSVWAVLKHCIGKDLSKITMPVIFNEPLTFLQRICEYMEYGHMLKTAQTKDDPCVRMQYVAAFAVSSTASNLHRVGKPFNPLLGETFELVREDLGYRIVTEQVSHHPPISALHCEGDGFKFHCSVQPKLKFWGKGVEAIPKGIVTLEFTGLEEAYTWNNITCCIHNIIIGQLWIEQYGQMEIINHTHGVKCVLNFKPCGWFGREANKIEGAIYNKNGQKEYILHGDWTDQLYCYPTKHKPSPSNGGQSTGSATGSTVIASSLSSNSNDSSDEEDDDCRILLWKVNPRPPNSEKMYNFTTFAMQLNEIHKEQTENLPQTDSRQRPDVRALEMLDIDFAADEKRRLEEKQRAARKERTKKKEEHVPCWFKEDQNPYLNQSDWIFTEEYWERDFTSRSPDIF